MSAAYKTSSKKKKSLVEKYAKYFVLISISIISISIFVFINNGKHIFASGPSGFLKDLVYTINNTGNTNTLTNYQVEVIVNTQALISAGQMQSGCQDIRFTTTSGTNMPYWIEGGCNTTSTQIWILIPSIPASSSLNFDMWYDNSTATAASDGSTTFNYFDQGNSLSNWTTVGSSGQNTTTGNPAPSYYASSSNGDYMYNNVGLIPGEVLTFNINSSGLGDFFFLTNSSGLGQMYRSDTRGIGSDYSGFATTSSWTAWSAPGSGFFSTVNTWYKFQIVVTSSTSASLYYKSTTGDSPSINGTLVGTYAITNDGGYIGLVGDALGSSYTTYIDNIITRQYSNPEPTVAIQALAPNSPITLTQQKTEVGLNTGTYYYEVSALTSQGQTTPSSEVSVSVSASGTSNKISWNPVVGATSYDLYRGIGSSTVSQYYNTTNTFLNDTNTLNWQATVPPPPSGFLKEQTYTVNNTGNTNTLTNYQVELTINTATLISASQMQSGCQDIRFRNAAGTLLSYWIGGGVILRQPKSG
ncbi:MAG: DUF2341 domain-containing protein [Patescibacteria group bacterium]